MEITTINHYDDGFYAVVREVGTWRLMRFLGPFPDAAAAREAAIQGAQRKPG